MLTTTGAVDLEHSDSAAAEPGGKSVNGLKWGIMSHTIVLALQAASPASAAAPVSIAQEDELVVITATQRTMAALDVPASVSVFATERLADSQINSIKQLISLTPALNSINSIGESFGQLITVRGISTSGADIGLEPAAGRYFLLGTASLSALSYEHNQSQPAIRFWDDTRHVGP